MTLGHLAKILDICVAKWNKIVAYSFHQSGGASRVDNGGATGPLMSRETHESKEDLFSPKDHHPPENINH